MSRAHIIKRNAAKREARKTKEEKKFENKKWNQPTRIPEERLWFTFGDNYYKMDYWIRIWNPLYGAYAYVRGYPNGGHMMATDGSGRMWGPEDKISVAMCIGEDQNCPIDSRLMMLEEADAALRLMTELELDADQALAIVRAMKMTKDERQAAYDEQRRLRGIATNNDRAAAKGPEGGSEPSS